MGEAMKAGGIELEPDGLYDPAEVSKATGLTEGTLATYRCTKGGMPYLKVGRGVRYQGKDVIGFLMKVPRVAGVVDKNRSAKARQRMIERHAARRAAVAS